MTVRQQCTTFGIHGILVLYTNYFLYLKLMSRPKLWAVHKLLIILSSVIIDFLVVFLQLVSYIH